MSFASVKRLSDDKIGNFVWLKPINPSSQQPVIEVLDRPNVEGLAFRALAKKGEPFRVQGMRDFKSISAARLAVQHLRNALHGQLCQFTMRDGSFFSRVMCLRVTELDIHEAIHCLGGVTGDPGDIWVGLDDPPVTVKGIAYVEFEVVHVGDAPP